MEELKIDVGGMSCGHCVKSVTQALQALHGVDVKQVVVGSATVSYDPAKTTPDQLAQAIEDAGYDVRPTQLTRSAQIASGQ